jgi:hypothetical protein
MREMVTRLGADTEITRENSTIMGDASPPAIPGP